HPALAGRRRSHRGRLGGLHDHHAVRAALSRANPAPKPAQAGAGGSSPTSVRRCVARVMATYRALAPRGSPSTIPVGSTMMTEAASSPFDAWAVSTTTADSRLSAP